MGYSRTTFKIQGVPFRLKATSPRNVKAVMEFAQDTDIEPGEDAADIMEAQADQYMEVLRLIADPTGDETFEDIDRMALDINKVDYYLEDFMPSGTAT